jgi:hypothetical protein
MLIVFNQVRIGFLNFGTRTPIQVDAQRSWNSPLLFRYDYWDTSENDCVYAYPPDLTLEPTYARWKVRYQERRQCSRI